MKTNRKVCKREDLTNLVKNDLKEFNISEIVIDTVLKSYLKIKRLELLNGSVIEEDNITTECLKVRGVSQEFSNNRSNTIKIQSSISYNLKTDAISKLDSDENYRNILNS